MSMSERDKPMFLPGVENSNQPSPYKDSIDLMKSAGPEYPKIWHMFAFKPSYRFRIEVVLRRLSR